jgi:hypothetical protein
VLASALPDSFGEGEGVLTDISRKAKESKIGNLSMSEKRLGK